MSDDRPTAPVGFEKPEKTISRSGFGLGVGAFMGYIFGGAAGAGFGAAAGLALAAMSTPEGDKGVMTEERQKLYDLMMLSEEDAAKIEKVAAAFDAEELHVHADLLRARAVLRRLTPETARDREHWFYRALCSSKPEAVDTLATTYKQEGAIIAYRTLRDHAGALRALKEGKVDDKMREEFERKYRLACEVFGDESKEAASAKKNLDAAKEVK